MKVLCSAVLAFEAIVVLLAIPLATGVVGGVTALTAGLVIAVLLIAAIGTLRRPWGAYFGSGLQVVVVLTGIVVPAMFALGAVFTVLWIVAVRTGSKVDALRRSHEQDQGIADDPGDGAAG